MDCEQIQAADIAEKYVTGGLSEVEQTEFENHFAGCQRCFEQVQLWQDMQDALLRQPRRNWRRLTVFALAASLLLVAGAALLGLRTVSRGESARATPAARPALDLAALATVLPPRYIQPRWRAAGPADFDVAMQRYSSGDYAGAPPRLFAAWQADPGNSAAAFFLGICYLMQGHDDQAIPQLKATIALGDSPELEESHFYLAKALLRKRDIAAAIGELRNAVRLHGPRELEERSLLDTLTGEAHPAK